jgi:hypothetical protein
MRPSPFLALLLVAGFLTGCGTEEAPEMAPEAPPTPAPAPDAQLAQPHPHDLLPEQEAFWSALQELCGRAFAGTDQEVQRVMHVRQCFPGEIRIPLHVDEDRSRTWIVTRQADGLRLKHDHRYDDGTEEEVTQYGGDTQDAGSPTAQEFWADDFTGELVPGAGNNIWTMEVHPGDRFAYQLVRTGEEWVVRWEFDLTEPVSAPPAPWGYEATEPTHGGE